MTGQVRALVLLVCLLCAGVGMAEPPPEAPPAAVGRIDRGPDTPPGAAICTGALVAPDLVLTAAHCLRGAGAHPAGLWFTAGRVVRRGAAVLGMPQASLGQGSPAPDVGPGTGASAPYMGTTTDAPAPDADARSDMIAALAGDLALLRLAAPVPAGEAAPLPLVSGGDAEARPASGPASGPEAAGFTLFAFRRDRPGAIPGAQTCKAIEGLPGVLGLGCPVVSGNSGAPLLARSGEGWAIAGVMVASNRNGPVRAWAAVPDAALRALIAAEAEGTPALTPD